MLKEKDKSRIDFPRRISFRKLDDLFEYVGRDLRTEVGYVACVTKKTGIDRFTKRKINRFETGIVRGFIYIGSLDNLSFSTLSEMNSYSGIQFEMIPGYSEEELRRTHTSNIDLVEKVRDSVDRYFSTKSFRDAMDKEFSSKNRRGERR